MVWEPNSRLPIAMRFATIETSDILQAKEVIEQAITNLGEHAKIISFVSLLPSAFHLPIHILSKCENCMVKFPLPWEEDRRAVEYPNIFESGTLAAII